MPAKNKPQDSRAKLLAHGRRVIARTGLRGLTVRGVAASAKVNLGTFVYHFGTRDKFIAELMENWYAPLYAQLSLTVDEHLPPLHKIRRYVLRLAEFVTANRDFIRHVLMDAADGEAAATRFVKSLFGRHPQLLFRLIGEAQAAGELRDGNPMKLGVTFIGAALFPIIMGRVLAPKGFLGKEAQAQFQQLVLAPEEIEQRLDWLLDGLRPPQNRKEHIS